MMKVASRATSPERVVSIALSAPIGHGALIVESGATPVLKPRVSGVGTLMAEDKWRASYLIWSQCYEREEDIWRAIIREKISHAVQRLALQKELGIAP